MQLMSKGAFADHIGVSPGRVSQYIAAGIIGPDALVGDGRAAKIDVAKAVAQVAKRRDPAQALGNGLLTRVTSAAPTPSAMPATEAPQLALPVPGDDDLATQLQREKLEGERRKNRTAARDEAIRQEQLVEAAQVRAEMTKMAMAIEEANAGMLADFAAALAEAYQLPQRDVLHLLRKVRNGKRAVVSAEAARKAETFVPRREVALEDEAA